MQYKTLQEVIELFLRKYLPAKEQVYCMCLAVAGPVTDNVAKITNLVSQSGMTAVERRVAVLIRCVLPSS